MSRARPILRAVQRPTRLPAEQGTGRVAKRRQVEVLPAAGDAPRVRRLLEGSPRTVVLSGAGVSTDSGIPDYRSPGMPPHRPIQHGEFMATDSARRRYWARSMRGYQQVRDAAPNEIHSMLGQAEKQGHLHHIITQNVDGLHEKHAQCVLRLHGDIHSVVCMSCSTRTNRQVYQRRLAAENLYVEGHQELLGSTELRPDGDINLPAEAADAMKVPGCDKCGGIMKPDVVMFGDNVPTDVTEESYRLVDEATFLLILGTTLSTRSALRLLERFVERCGSGSAAIVNRGATRGDYLVPPAYRFEESLKHTLQKILP